MEQRSCPAADITGMTSHVDALDDRVVLRARLRLWWLRRHQLCGTHARALNLAAYGSLMDISGRFYVTRAKQIMGQRRRCAECQARLAEIETLHDLLTRARVAKIAARSKPA